MFQIKIYNNIAKQGLALFDKKLYKLIQDETNPSALLLRSHKLTLQEIENTVLAVARAGAGVNNIPVDALTQRGIVVFNTPGANANAVKELVIAGMFLSARNILPAWNFVNNINQNNSLTNQEELNQTVEIAKKQFKGFELPGKVLAVIGLGAIGVKVANAAHSLGMKVIGYDPAITVERAWELSSNVIKAKTMQAAVKQADFITVHVPYNKQTEHLINHDVLSLIKPEAVLLNFARNKIVDEELVQKYLDTNKLRTYVTDFPSQSLINNPKIILLPHIGASTQEAEENCAILAAESLINYLEKGIIRNSVNFPEVIFNEECQHRIAVINKNIPNMVAQITSILAEDQLNIIDLINKSRENIAYSLIDLDNKPSDNIINKIKNITGIISARRITRD